MSIAAPDPSRDTSDPFAPSYPNVGRPTDGTAFITDVAIRHLFGVTLALASLLELSSDEEVRRRIQTIISDTDDSIQGLRHARSEAGTGLARAVPTPASLTSSNSSPERELVATLLREASLTIDRSLDFIRRRSHGTANNLEVNLEDASWAVHRALITLMT